MAILATANPVLPLKHFGIALPVVLAAATL